MKRMICIVCPKGCRLTVNEADDFAVEGASCERGVKYAKAEAQNPTRVLTSTVKIKNAEHNRCPVKTKSPIPKHKLFEIMRQLTEIELEAPVFEGQTVIRDVCGTGVEIVVTRDMAGG